MTRERRWSLMTKIEYSLEVSISAIYSPDAATYAESNPSIADAKMVNIGGEVTGDSLNAVIDRTIAYLESVKEQKQI